MSVNLDSEPWGCTVSAPRQVSTRETGRAFTEAEAGTILRAASATTINSKIPFTAAKRWVPWLAAYSGARGGELTQLRAEDIDHERKAIKITPDAGPVKTRKVRVVPLHEHMIEQGFLEWARKQRGPLFHHPAKADSPENYRGPAVKARERLAEWVREIGVDDPEVSPLHGWRHLFKRKAARAGIEAVLRDAFVGHAPRNVADMYEEPEFEDLARAIVKFPRYPALRSVGAETAHDPLRANVSANARSPGRRTQM
jgi:integrase